MKECEYDGIDKFIILFYTDGEADYPGNQI